MKLGIFGLGKMGNLYVRDFKSFGANIAGAVCSTYQSAEKKVFNLNSKYHLSMKAFKDEHELFQQDIDTIAICSNIETHLRFLEESVNQKKKYNLRKTLFLEQKIF